MKLRTFTTMQLALGASLVVHAALLTVRFVDPERFNRVFEDTPLEDAARIMADNKIGGLPVVRDGALVGIITETDLFKVFLEMLGARERGMRVTVLVANEPGQLATLTRAIAEGGGNIIALTEFSGTASSNRRVMVKATGIDKAKLRGLIAPLVTAIEDIREV